MALEKNTVAERVLLVLENLVLEPYNIERDSTFEDMGMDSLDKVELLMDLEDEFSIEIPDEVITYLETFGEIIDYIEKHTK